jgi:hypothetical protein
MTISLPHLLTMLAVTQARQAVIQAQKSLSTPRD